MPMRVPVTMNPLSPTCSDGPTTSLADIVAVPIVQIQKVSYAHVQYSIEPP